MLLQPCLQANPLATRPAAAPAGLPTGPAVMDWLDRKSCPAEHTHGDMEKASYLQAGLGGAVEGLAMAGLPGAVSACAASLTGVLVERLTDRPEAGLVAGGLVGAGLGAAIAWFSGADVGSRAITGGLLGVFETLGGSAAARVRDSSDFGAVTAGFMLPGAAKAAGGVAGALASRYASEWHPLARTALGAALGAGLGAGLAGAGFGGLGAGLLMGASALGGAVGTGLGPRGGQFIRNLSHDLGSLTEKGLLKTGAIKEPLSPAVAGCLGALPAGFLSEFGKSYVYSDGSLLGLLIGGTTQTIQLVDVFMNSNPKDEDEVYASLP